MEESEFRDLLQQSEPECPVINRTEILLALTSVTTTAATSATTSGPTSVPTAALTSAVVPGDVTIRRPSTERGALAVVGACLAVTSLAIALAFVPELTNPPAEPLLVEHHKSQHQLAQLEAARQSLSEIRSPPLSAADATAIRASESLWMLLQADTTNQRDQAETIVALYANTPAAHRCRQMFPDIHLP